MGDFFIPSLKTTASTPGFETSAWLKPDLPHAKPLFKAKCNFMGKLSVEYNNPLKNKTPSSYPYNLLHEILKEFRGYMIEMYQ